MIAELEPFRGTNFLTRINRAFRPVARELKAAGTTGLSVEVQSNPDASILKNLFTFKLHYGPNQWLYARGIACGFRFCVTLPFRNGVTLPYLLEINLDSATPLCANLGAWFTRRGRWFAEPLNSVSARRINKLRLPGVGWKHVSGGLKHTLMCGGYILPPDNECNFNRWIVHSAYQGFLIVRPRIVKYLRAASRLDALLNSWPVDKAPSGSRTRTSAMARQ
jgi:hypothetical protein